MVIFKQVETPAEADFYWHTRHKYFVNEIHLFEKTDRDDCDKLKDTDHIVVKKDGKLMGILRIIKSNIPAIYNNKYMAKLLRNNGVKVIEISRLYLQTNESSITVRLQLLRFLYQVAISEKIDFIICECLNEKFSLGIIKLLPQATIKLQRTVIRDPAITANGKKNTFIYPILIEIEKVRSQDENKLKKLEGLGTV